MQFQCLELDDGPVRRRVIITIVRGRPSKEAAAGRRSLPGDDAIAERLASVYAKYKVAFCERASRSGSDSPLTELVILPHYDANS